MVVHSKNTAKIVSAAMSLLRSRGYASVMVKDICREAGVSHSSFYAVFTGKDDVLLHVLRGYKDDAEDTMRRLLLAESDLEKIWILYVKYLTLAEEFGPELMGALFALELEGKCSVTEAVNEYMERYLEWFLRFVGNCQKAGIIRNKGRAQDLIPLGVELTFFIVYEWCVSQGRFPLRERAFSAMENLFDIAPEHRGVRPCG